MERRRRALLVLCTTFALLGLTVVPLPVVAIGEPQVTLNCDDGTKLDLTPNADQLLALKDAVAAMALYPAGLACVLTEEPTLGVLGTGVARASNPHYDYVVGGGHQGLPPCDYNFAIQAHVESGAAPTEATGHFNVLIPATCPPEVISESRTSQLTVEIECLMLTSSSTAAMSGTAQKASGSLGAEGPRIHIAASDNSPDGLEWHTSGFSTDCATSTTAPISSGNITIGSGS